MIVKIENNKGGYLVVDNVQDFDYLVKSCETVTEEMDRKLPLDNEDNIEREIFKGNSKFYKEVYFRNESRFFRFRTDRCVYIMNNEGKTIDKLN